MLPIEKIDRNWTLFLDRDGVINYEKDRDYIHTKEEFRFYENVHEAFEIFSRKFKRVIIVTNQRGVGKGVTKETDLIEIHDHMQAEIVKHNGRVDAVYYCTDVNDESENRKPNAGMGKRAAAEFPDIDLSKAVMVGNTLSDMLFGRNLGIYTVFLPTTRPEVKLDDPFIDAVFSSLFNFASALP